MVMIRVCGGLSGFREEVSGFRVDLCDFLPRASVSATEHDMTVRTSLGDACTGYVTHVVAWGRGRGSTMVTSRALHVTGRFTRV